MTLKVAMNDGGAHQNGDSEDEGLRSETKKTAAAVVVGALHNPGRRA